MPNFDSKELQNRKVNYIIIHRPFESIT